MSSPPSPQSELLARPSTPARRRADPTSQGQAAGPAGIGPAPGMGKTTRGLLPTDTDLRGWRVPRTRPGARSAARKARREMPRRRAAWAPPWPHHAAEAGRRAGTGVEVGAGVGTDRPEEVGERGADVVDTRPDFDHGGGGAMGRARRVPLPIGNPGGVTEGVREGVGPGVERGRLGRRGGCGQFGGCGPSPGLRDHREGDGARGREYVPRQRRDLRPRQAHRMLQDPRRVGRAQRSRCR